MNLKEFDQIRYGLILYIWIFLQGLVAGWWFIKSQKRCIFGSDYCKIGPAGVQKNINLKYT